MIHAIKDLFAKGDHEGAYALYMRDPSGGGNPELKRTTKAQFVSAMHSMSDTQGKSLFPRQLSHKQLAAVNAFRDAQGRYWKSKLSTLWANGDYRRYGLDIDQFAMLQQVRNQFGPNWLKSVKV